MQIARGSDAPRYLTRAENFYVIVSLPSPLSFPCISQGISAYRGDGYGVISSYNVAARAEID